MPQSKTEAERTIGFHFKTKYLFCHCFPQSVFLPTLFPALHCSFFHQDMQKQKSNFTQVFVGSGHSSLSLVSNFVTSSVCAPNDPQTYRNFPSLLSDHKTGFQRAAMLPPFNSEASPCITVFFFLPNYYFL